jgi:hypothetical protein
MAGNNEGAALQVGTRQGLAESGDLRSRLRADVVRIVFEVHFEIDLSRYDATGLPWVLPCLQDSARALPQSNLLDRAYDQQIGIFSDDLSFDPRAVEVLKQSFIEMGLLKDIPEDKAMFTTQFLPVKAGL